jgi:lysyl-tRNA synthetase class 1
MILQIHDGDIDGTIGYYAAAGEITSDEERELCRQRAVCAWRWITTYAPEEFCYRIREEAVVNPLSDEEATVLGRLVSLLRDQPEITEKGMVPHMKTLTEGTDLDNQSFLPVVYELLIGRPKGPKITTLVTTMGTARAIALLEPSLQARV